MKYTKELPRVNKKFSQELIEKGWIKIKESPNVLMAILLSLPFMILNTVLYFLIIYLIHPPFKSFFTSQDMSFSVTINITPLLFLVIGSFIMMTLHELIHAFFIPNVFNSTKTYWGVKGLYGFVFTTEKLTKSSFLIISVMPFFLLSIVFPIVLSFFGWLNHYILILCLLNAAGSSVDFLTIFLILTQVPNGSMIINNGFETYFLPIAQIK